MTTFTVKSQTWAKSAADRIEALETNPLVQEILAWGAMVGLAILGFVVFIIATWI